MATIGSVSPNIAANAYSNSNRIGGAGDVTKINQAQTGFAQNDPIYGPKEEGGVTFADMLRDNIQSSVKTMRGGEEMSAKAVTGEADLTDVVQAVTSAELTLQTVVALRDRMISAYQEIMRMTI